MSETKIEWADRVWNPVVGCSRVSEGCRNCYAERMAVRLQAMGTRGYEGVVDDHGRWTGRVNVVEDLIDEPRRWRKPARIFVNSMSDLFHPAVPDDIIARVWYTMSACASHTFLVLTKRPDRMRDFLTQCGDTEAPQGETYGYITHDGTPPRAYDGTGIIVGRPEFWPLPNVWLGVSVEDQATANERIPALLDTPAAVRFVSCEPLLGPVSLAHIPAIGEPGTGGESWIGPRIDWVIAGGESGPGARPMHPDWARSLRDQCYEAQVPFFFKQWGEWSSDYRQDRRLKYTQESFVHGCAFYRYGSKSNGRLLDGEEWSEFPKPVNQEA